MKNTPMLDESKLQIIPTPTALEAIERANIDMQIATAKRFPRKLKIVKERMLELATLDQETASSCFYKLNRAGKQIEGPSIRLAEIAGSCFGNLRYGARVISNDGKIITAQAYCHDLETNVFSQMEVQRRITDKNGYTYSDDMQIVTGNAACAIAARNAIFKVVPFAFVKPIFAAAKKTAVGDAKTLTARRSAMLEQFGEYKVSEKRICAVLGRDSVEEIGLTDLETLIGLYNSIKDGEQTIEEAFPSLTIDKPKIGEPPFAPVGIDAPLQESPSPKKQLVGLDAPKKTNTAEQKVIEKLDLLGMGKSDLVRVARYFEALDESQDWNDIDEKKFAVFLKPDNWTQIVEELNKLRQ